MNSPASADPGAPTAWPFPDQPPLPDQLLRLDTLTDAPLHDLLVRVQTLLLDRPPAMRTLACASCWRSTRAAGRAAGIERLLVMADEITLSRDSVAARATASISTPTVSAMRSNLSIPVKPTSPRGASPSPPPLDAPCAALPRTRRSWCGCQPGRYVYASWRSLDAARDHRHGG